MEPESIKRSAGGLVDVSVAILRVERRLEGRARPVMPTQVSASVTTGLTEVDRLLTTSRVDLNGIGRDLKRRVQWIDDDQHRRSPSHGLLRSMVRWRPKRDPLRAAGESVMDMAGWVKGKVDGPAKRAWNATKKFAKEHWKKVLALVDASLVAFAAVFLRSGRILIELIELIPGIDSPTADQLKRAVEWILDHRHWFRAKAEQAAKYLRNLAVRAKTKVKVAIERVKDFVRETRTKLVDLGKRAWNRAKAMGRRAIEIGKELMEKFVEKIRAAGRTIKQYASKAWDGVRKFGAKVADLAKATFRIAKTGVKWFVQRALPWLGRAALKVLGVVLRFAGRLAVAAVIAIIAMVSVELLVIAAVVVAAVLAISLIFPDSTVTQEQENEALRRHHNSPPVRPMVHRPAIPAEPTPPVRPTAQHVHMASAPRRSVREQTFIRPAA